jgi:hypothetical protein
MPLATAGIDEAVRADRLMEPATRNISRNAPVSAFVMPSRSMPPFDGTPMYTLGRSPEGCWVGGLPAVSGAGATGGTGTPSSLLSVRKQVPALTPRRSPRWGIGREIVSLPRTGAALRLLLGAPIRLSVQRLRLVAPSHNGSASDLDGSFTGTFAIDTVRAPWFRGSVNAASHESRPTEIRRARSSSSANR